jgi:NhaA family Na+:H+ antiporter
MIPQQLKNLFADFFNSEKTAGILLITCTVISLIITNSSFGTSYLQFWEHDLGGHSITEWINDGLMSIFFLLIGLELEREIYAGELSDIKKAALPAIGALGGVIAPASIYLIFNFGTPTQSGAGIPMATDIAFAIGILALLGKRVPLSLKIFLTALAVIDDLCAILIIAFFYSKGIHWLDLCISLGIFLLLLLMNRMNVASLLPYLVGGVLMWYFMLHSGIHPTISGVLLAFAIPFRSKKGKSISETLEHYLHRPVAYFIIPIFALANTCIVIDNNWTTIFQTNAGGGILAGLVIGKPLGILIFSGIAVALGICQLPGDIRWKHLLGAGMLAGIGFTMSIFITMLAFDDVSGIQHAKLSILAASLLASLIGLVTLWIVLKKEKPGIKH